VRFYANEKQNIASQLEKNQNNREDLQRQLTRVNQNIQTNQTKLETENQVFSSQEQSIKSQISSTESALDSLREKDQQFTNTIETVTGNIKLQWVSFTDIIGLYLPKQWLPISFFLLAVVTVISSRYRTVD
jgi:predicted  nucleic acid-binding Zn-ribbon protein